MASEVPRFSVNRVPDCPPDIGLWLAIIDSARQGTLHTVRNLTVEVLDAAPAAGINTVGTILYHIALTDLNWVYDNLLELPYPDDVVGLFSYPLTDEQGRLSQVSGWPIDAYIERLDAARQKVHEVYKALTYEAFYEVLSREGEFGPYEMTPESVLRHLALHEAQHLGEISLLLGASAQQG